MVKPMRYFQLLVSLTVCISITACKPNDSGTTAAAENGSAAASTTQQPRFHPSWDANGDGVNDCEKEDSCDHSIDYTLPRTAITSQPSFDCTRVAEGSIEHLVCSTPELAALDNRLQGVYSAASSKAANQHPPVLQAEQNGWIKGRNECWKADDKPLCIKTEYQRRVAELQARYQLVAAKGPFQFQCGKSSGDRILVTFYESDIPTLIAERGDQTSLMYQVPAASGAKFQGRNESFWEHHGEATVTWGYNTPEFVCKKTE